MRWKLPFIFVLVCVSSLFGTSVVRLPLTEIANHSGQIIVGTVDSIESYWTEEFGTRTIESRIRLEYVEYFKGKRDNSTTFSFTVPGGTVGNMSMQIAGAPVFKVNETWVLFLHPEWKSFPTVGLYQGAYQLVHGIVKDGNGVPIAGINADGFVESSLAKTSLQGKARTQNAVVQARVVSKKPMAQESFLDLVESVAKQSKPIPLTQNAGKRVPADYTSVPLKEKQ